MTKAETAHKSAVAALGCAACWRIHGPHEPGEVQLHHFRGGGWGKGGYLTLVGLCYEHHHGKFGIHGMGTKAFDAHYSDVEVYGERAFTQKQLLADTLERVNA